MRPVEPPPTGVLAHPIALGFAAFCLSVPIFFLWVAWMKRRLAEQRRREDEEMKALEVEDVEDVPRREPRPRPNDRRRRRR